MEEPVLKCCGFTCVIRWPSRMHRRSLGHSRAIQRHKGWLRLAAKATRHLRPWSEPVLGQRRRTRVVPEAFLLPAAVLPPKNSSKQLTTVPHCHCEHTHTGTVTATLPHCDCVHGHFVTTSRRAHSQSHCHTVTMYRNAATVTLSNYHCVHSHSHSVTATVYTVTVAHLAESLTVWAKVSVADRPYAHSTRPAPQ